MMMIMVMNLDGGMTLTERNPRRKLSLGLNATMQVLEKTNSRRLSSAAIS